MRFTIQRPDLGKALAETEKSIKRTITSRRREIADNLKQDLRADVVAVRFSDWMSRTRRGKTFHEVGARKLKHHPAKAERIPPSGPVLRQRQGDTARLHTPRPRWPALQSMLYNPYNTGRSLGHG